MSKFAQSYVSKADEVPEKLEYLEKMHGSVINFQIVKYLEEAGFYIFTQHESEE